jgi:hypothetical protein
MKAKNIDSYLYKGSRTARDIEILLSGNPYRIIRRIKNKIIGRVLARIGFWKLLWG